MCRRRRPGSSGPSDRMSRRKVLLILDHSTHGALKAHDGNIIGRTDRACVAPCPVDIGGDRGHLQIVELLRLRWHDTTVGQAIDNDRVVEAKQHDRGMGKAVRQPRPLSGQGRDRTTKASPSRSVTRRTPPCPLDGIGLFAQFPQSSLALVAGQPVQRVGWTLGSRYRPSHRGLGNVGSVVGRRPVLRRCERSSTCDEDQGESPPRSPSCHRRHGREHNRPTASDCRSVTLKVRRQSEPKRPAFSWIALVRALLQLCSCCCLCCCGRWTGVGGVR